MWTLSHEMRIDRQKLRKNCDFTCPGATLSHEMRVDRQKLRKIAILLVPEQPFRTKWGSIVKNWGKIDFTCAGLVLEQPFRTKWGSIVENWGKIAILLVPDLSRSNPFARNEGRSSKTEVKLRFYLCRTCPGATLSHEMRVDAQKLR